MLRPNGSWGTCIPQGMRHSFLALHGAPFDFPILLLSGAVDVRGERVGVVVSGGNVGLDRFRALIS